jgi:hypothetical protein
LRAAVLQASIERSRLTQHHRLSPARKHSHLEERKFKSFDVIIVVLTIGLSVGPTARATCMDDVAAAEE